MSRLKDTYQNEIVEAMTKKFGYKNKLEVFPSNIVAGMFGFKPEPFFEANETERETPKVQF